MKWSVLVCVICAGMIGVGFRYLATYNSTGSKKAVIVALINICGSFAIGYIATVLKTGAHPTLLPALTIGLLGGLTTFSTFSLDVVTALEESRIGFAVGLACGTVFISLIFCYAGIVLGRLIAN